MNLKWNIQLENLKQVHDLKRDSGVYCLCIKDKIVYVGASRTLKKRVSRFFHRSHNGHSKILYEFLNEVDKFSPKKVFVRFCNVENLPQLEQRYIYKLKPLCNDRFSYSYQSRLSPAKSKSG